MWLIPLYGPIIDASSQLRNGLPAPGKTKGHSLCDDEQQADARRQVKNTHAAASSFARK
jgi:hypothetical protein